jgi:glutathione S-transferase
MLKVWGRTTSSNVQKVMWALGEIGVPCERIDVGGPFGKTREPDYLAMNPNALVPTLQEEDGWVLWESNSIVRYLAAKYQARILEPTDLRVRAQAQKWMDWQLSVAGPAIFPLFWGLVRTPPEKRDPAAIAAGRQKTGEALMIFDAQLAKTRFAASDAFSYGDIPLGPIVHRYLSLVPPAERAPIKNVERWYAELCTRPPFKQHVVDIPLT